MPWGQRQGRRTTSQKEPKGQGKVHRALKGPNSSQPRAQQGGIAGAKAGGNPTTWLRSDWGPRHKEGGRAAGLQDRGAVQASGGLRDRE